LVPAHVARQHAVCRNLAVAGVRVSNWRIGTIFRRKPCAPWNGGITLAPPPCCPRHQPTLIIARGAEFVRLSACQEIYGFNPIQELHFLRCTQRLNRHEPIRFTHHPFTQDYFTTALMLEVSFRYSQYWWSNRYYAMLACRHGSLQGKVLNLAAGWVIYFHG
jgi:hypothetical protein